MYYSHDFLSIRLDHISEASSMTDREIVRLKSLIAMLENLENGIYKYIDKFLVLIIFSKEEYILKFNSDHTQFISIRNKDYITFKGKIIITKK